MIESVRKMYDLTGKTVVVTGACTGLGWDMAQAYAEYGCRVVITSRDGGKAAAAARKLADETGAETLGAELDQRDYPSCEALMRTVVGRFGNIDVLVNNAGGGSGIGECCFFDRDPAAIQNMLNTNLTGSLFCCRAVCGIMRDRGKGVIINIGSTAGITGRLRDMYHDTHKMEQPVEYAAAKAGVIGMTRDLAAVMAPYGVRVNCISPGGFDKGELSEAFVNAYSARTALGHMGKIGSDITGVAIFLASDASKYITGQNIVVDGGFTTCK